MAMKKVVPAASPEAYVAALSDWRRPLVESIRKSVLAAGKVEERIKWGNVVFFHEGPIAMIRAEEARVLFGFWRGKRLREVDERLKPGGKYEMATIELRAGDSITAAQARKLAKAAIALNDEFGDPCSVG
jgi:hypothetical protein